MKRKWYQTTPPNSNWNRTFRTKALDFCIQKMDTLGRHLCYYAFMRTTVDLPDELFRKAKAKAAIDGISLRDLIEAGVRHVLAEPSVPGDERQAWLTRLDDLFEAADQRDANNEGTAGPFSRDELYAGRLDRFR